METTTEIQDGGICVSKPSVWKTPRFQKFVLITIGTGLLLSLVASFAMKRSVDSLTQKKLPYIESQVSDIKTR